MTDTDLIDILLKRQLIKIPWRKFQHYRMSKGAWVYFDRIPISKTELIDLLDGTIEYPKD